MIFKLFVTWAIFNVRDNTIFDCHQRHEFIYPISIVNISPVRITDFVPFPIYFLIRVRYLVIPFVTRKCPTLSYGLYRNDDCSNFSHLPPKPRHLVCYKYFFRLSGGGLIRHHGLHCYPTIILSLVLGKQNGN